MVKGTTVHLYTVGRDTMTHTGPWGYGRNQLSISSK